MAALTITAANVLAAADATQKTVVAGETVTAGMVLYKKPADSKYYKAKGNASATRGADGIALCGGANNQPIVIARPDLGGGINLGATLAVGQTYVVADADANAGEIVPLADLGSGDYPVIIGIATTTSNLLMDSVDAGVAKP